MGTIIRRIILYSAGLQTSDGDPEVISWDVKNHYSDHRNRTCVCSAARQRVSAAEPSSLQSLELPLKDLQFLALDR